MTTQPDPNWNRWITASLAKWFSDACKAANLYFYIEGDDRATENQSNYAEFRLYGPSYCQISNSWWKVHVEINILIASKRDDKNIYTLQTNTGVITAAFALNIPVLKYGTGPQDDQSQLGCLQITNEQNNQILVTNLGQLGPDLTMSEALVEGYYNMWLDTNPQ